MIRFLPNLISLLRLGLVPVILLFIWQRRYESALIWYFIAGVSDGLDGFLARRLNAMSKVGGYLDPVADKLLLSGSYLVLGLDRVIPWWLTGVVFARDILILAAVGYAMLFTSIRSFKPTIWGKISTVIQIATVLTVLLGRASYWGDVPRTVEPLAIGLTLLATTWSAIHYGWVAVRMLKSAAAR